MNVPELVAQVRGHFIVWFDMETQATRRYTEPIFLEAADALEAQQRVVEAAREVNAITQTFSSDPNNPYVRLGFALAQLDSLK